MSNHRNSTANRETTIEVVNVETAARTRRNNPINKLTLVAAHTRLILCKDPTILSCINQNLAKFAPSLSLCVDAQYLAQYSLCVDSHLAKLFK